MPIRAVVSWSSGKDSAWALHVAARSPDVELVGVLTTVTSEYGRVSMHGVRERLLDRQIVELGLPCRKVRIPAPCPNEVYQREMGAAMRDCLEMGVEQIIFGDLFLEDVRAYREAHLAEVGLVGRFPLWGADTLALAGEMLDAGLRATLTCVDSRQLDPAFAGRTYDRRLLEELPDGVDPCGENGEFHTVVTAGPMLRRPLDVRVGDVVEREGFVFADVA